MKKILILVLTLVLALSVGAYFYLKRPQNIFDEMYQATKRSYQSNNVFNNLNNVEVHNYQEYSNGSKFYSVINYRESALPERNRDLELVFHFIQGNRSVFISFEKEIGKNTRIWIYGRYQLDKKELQKNVQIILLSGESDDYIDNESEVKSYLKEHGITSDDLNNYYDEIVNQKVLKDWCSIYDSHFSPTDYGDVTVETQWEDW